MERKRKRLEIIAKELTECERAARREGWEGRWECQPGDLDYIAKCLISAGLATAPRPGTGRHVFTPAELEYIGIADAFWHAWLRETGEGADDDDPACAPPRAR